MSLSPVRVRRSWIASLVLAGIVAAVWTTSRSAHAAAALDPVDATIKQSMEQMNDAMKALSKPITADTKEAALGELVKFETAVMAAKSLTPGSAAKVDEKKRAAFVGDFRKTLIEALEFACQAEAAITDGKYKDADKLINNKLAAMKSAGHSKFKDDGK